MEKAIEVLNLSKSYGRLKALSKVNLSVAKGEVFGLLGPNGAGKTTLISILATLSKPSSGTAMVGGINVVKKPGAIRANIGMVFQDTVLDPDLTGFDNLDFHARLYKLPKSRRNASIREVVKLVGLEKHLFRKVKDYSGGMKRRLEIARGMLHHPKVLFLDEPTLGLDPLTRRKVLEYIKHLRDVEKITVILTTHYIEEADFLCDRIAVIDSGSIKVVGIPNSLKKRNATLEDVYLKVTGHRIKND